MAFAARAGVGRTTAQNAMREARARLGHCAGAQEARTAFAHEHRARVVIAFLLWKTYARAAPSVQAAATSAISASRQSRPQRRRWEG